MPTKKKILLTGGSGLLGGYIARAASERYELLSLYHTNPASSPARNVKCDITKSEELENVFHSFQPDIVIHTAAVSNPKNADALTPATVFAINVAATESLARIAAKNGTRFIYTSTDLVYAGYRGSMLSEEAKLVPATLYAETKLMGERKIKQFSENYLILRTALLYGFAYNAKKNFFHLMVEAFERGEKMDVFTDQFRTPLYLADAARIITELIESPAKNEIINFGGPERLARVEMGELICKYGNFPLSLLNKVIMAERPEVVPVADVSLDTSKLRSLGISQTPVEECVRHAFENRAAH